MKVDRLFSVRSCVVVSSLLLTQVCLGDEFKIDTGHSNVQFVARHLVSKVKGEFKEFEGQVSFDAKKPEASKVVADVKVGSINTNQKNRDEHLLSDDFFAAKQNPTLHFASTKVSPDGQGKYKMAGDLTLRGVTKPVVFDVDYMGETKGPAGDRRLGFTATTKINRKDFGMNFSKTLDTGGVVVGDEVQIDINIEAAEKDFKPKKM